MTRTYLVRGMLVGLLASIAAFAFAKTMGEPQITKAEAFEEQMTQQHGAHEDDPVVSRAVQDTVGLGAGLVGAAVAYGGLFAIAFAFAYGRLILRSARATAALIAAIAFTAVNLVPFLKYPANPPAIGDPDTIGRRTALYLVLVAIAILATALAGIIRSRLLARLGAWNASIAAIGLFCVVIGLTYIVMPGVNEVPAGFPVLVLWRFRLASIGMQALLWAGIGLGFGALTDRASRLPA